MRSEMCRVSRPHAVAGLRWHTQLTGGIRSSARHGSRVAGLRRVALFFRPRHIQVLGWTLLRWAWSGAGAAASFAWSLALEAESAAIEGEDADHHGEAVVHQPG